MPHAAITAQQELAAAITALTAAIERIAAEQPQPPAQPGKINWQQAICIGIPIYNMFAAAQDWPTLPLPSFCSTTFAK